MHDRPRRSGLPLATVRSRRSPEYQTAAVTWRPLYVPQFGHTVWGSVFSPHPRLGQVMRVGAVVFHWLRRDRVLDRDILRFGTATSTSPRTRSVQCRAGEARVVQAQGAPAD